MRRLAPLAVLFLLVGCVGAEPGASGVVEAADTEATIDYAPLLALMEGVPCEADVGEGTSENLLKLGELMSEFPMGEVDVRDHLLIGYTSSPKGMYVIDLRDPLDMQVLSHIEVDVPGGVTDVKWTPSGDGAYFGTTGGISLIDLTDLAAPALAMTLDLPNQGHSLAARIIAGEEWIYVSGQTAPDGTYVLKREGWDLTFVSEYKTQGLLSTPLGHHDPVIVNDALLGDKPVMYVSQGFEGWSAADLSDPANPVRIGGSLPEGIGYTHMVRVAFMDGKRIVASMQEAGDNALHIYDATDLSMPKLIARWKADPARPHIPQHNLQIAGDHLYMAHYSMGLYVWNLTDIVANAGAVPQLQPAPVAHYAVETPDDPDVLGFSDFQDVQLDDGILFVTDSEDALLAIGFGCITPGDRTQASRL